MTILQKAGFFNISFAPNDFQGDAKGAKPMIDAIKKRIGHISRHENGFDFDPETNVWYIRVTEFNREILEECKAKYFGDPDQISLF